MEFWGMELPPKQAMPIVYNDNTYLHLTQAALGTNPKDGERVVLQIGFGDQKYVLGTLVKSTCDQMHLDLVVDKDFTLEHNGSASVFVAGYVTTEDLEEDRDEDDEDEDEEEDEEGEEEEEEAVVNVSKGNGLPEKRGPKQADGKPSKAEKRMEAAKAAFALVKAAGQLKKKKGGAAQAKEEDEEDEDDEDEEDDDEEDVAGLVLRGAKEFEDMDDDDDLDTEDDEFADDLADEDDDDDEEELEDGDFDEDDDDDEDDDEEDDEEDDEMDADEEAVENAQPPPKIGKRPAPAAKTPGSQKKAKVEAQTPKTPAAAQKTPGKDKTPAAGKTPKTPAAGASLGKYQCQPCSKTFTTETALSQHNSAKHK